MLVGVGDGGWQHMGVAAGGYLGGQKVGGSGWKIAAVAALGWRRRRRKKESLVCCLLGCKWPKALG